MPLKAFVIILLGVAGISCAAPEVRETAPAPLQDAGWIDALARAVGDRRVLQLGESGHGMAETYKVKTDIVRRMHQRYGFDVLAVEGGLAECWVAAQNLETWSAEQSMDACFWGAWSSAEAEELFNYLRSAAASRRPLRLVGFDNSPTSMAFMQWLESNPGTPPALLAAERDFIRLFDVSPEEDEPMAPVRARAVTNYQQAYAALEDPGLRMIVADRLATLDFDPEAFSREVFERTREKRMAANLLQHIADNPGSKVMVWAHNAHVAHAYSGFVGGVERQGEFVQRALGEQSYTVGIYPLAGRGYAWFINQEYELRVPRAGSLESELAQLPGNPVFFDLLGADARAQPWTRQQVVSFEWGLNEQMIVPAQMYDGLLLIREVTPITRSID